MLFRGNYTAEVTLHSVPHSAQVRGQSPSIPRGKQLTPRPHPQSSCQGNNDPSQPRAELAQDGRIGLACPLIELICAVDLRVGDARHRNPKECAQGFPSIAQTQLQESIRIHTLSHPRVVFEEAFLGPSAVIVIAEHSIRGFEHAPRWPQVLGFEELEQVEYRLLEPRNNSAVDGSEPRVDGASGENDLDFWVQLVEIFPEKTGRYIQQRVIIPTETIKVIAVVRTSLTLESAVHRFCPLVVHSARVVDWFAHMP